MRALAAALAVAVTMALSACGSSPAPRPASTVTVTAAPGPVQPAVIDDTGTPPGAQFCQRLESAPDPAAYYAAEVAYQARPGFGGGLSTAATTVKLWIMISCPQFSYLVTQPGQ